MTEINSQRHEWSVLVPLPFFSVCAGWCLHKCVGLFVISADGELAATIVVSLAVFFILFFGVLLYVTRRNRRGSATTSAVRQRIQRMNNNSNNPAAGPVEADEAGFTEQEQQEHGLEDVQVDEFGQSTARRHSRQASNSSFHDHVDGAADGGEPQTWLSSTTSSGTKSYLGGWFGLDSVSCPFIIFFLIDFCLEVNTHVKADFLEMSLRSQISGLKRTEAHETSALLRSQLLCESTSARVSRARMTVTTMILSGESTRAKMR